MGAKVRGQLVEASVLSFPCESVLGDHTQVILVASILPTETLEMLMPCFFDVLPEFMNTSLCGILLLLIETKLKFLFVGHLS